MAEMPNKTTEEAKMLAEKMSERLQKEGVMNKENSDKAGEGVAKGMGQNPYYSIQGLGDRAVWQKMKVGRVEVIEVTVLYGGAVFTASADMGEKEKSLGAAKKLAKG